MSNGKRVMLLSSETPSAVAAVRSLDAVGLDAVALAEGFLSPASLSRHCTARVRSGVWHSLELRDHVRALLPHVLLPVTEADLVRLAPVREELEQTVKVLAPPADVLALATDKFASVKTAGEAGVRIPQQALLAKEDPVSDWSADDFPAVAKPGRSRALLDDGTVWSGTASYVGTGTELARLQADFAQAGLDTVLQRIVPGVAVLVSLLLTESGDPSLVFVHRRVRELRPEGGPSSCAVSHDNEPGLVEPAIAAARALGLFGAPAQFEFRAVPGEEPVLLDVNPRPWGTLGLALDCGVNFYGVAAWHALGEPLPVPPPRYRRGVFRRYLPFELRRSLTALIDAPQSGYEGPWPSLLDALTGVMVPPGEGLVGRIDDPIASLADAVRAARRAFG